MAPDEIKNTRLVLLPPWWRTTWAYVLYGLLLLAGLVAIDRVQRRRLLRKAELQQAELQARASKALAEVATSQAREAEAERRALQAENKRQQLELEKAHELKVAYDKLKTTQAQLIQSEKMASLGQLTAGIAHEIKNPLNFVTNFAELNEELADELREEYEANPEVKLAEVLNVLDDLKTSTGQIAKHGKRADGIVRTMMQHASGGTGRREVTEVNALVEGYVNLAYHGIRAQEEDLKVDLERAYDEGVGQVLMRQRLGLG